MQVQAPRFSGVSLTEIYAPNGELLYRDIAIHPKEDPTLAEDEVQLHKGLLSDDLQKTSLGHSPLAKQLTGFFTTATPTAPPDAEKPFSVSLPEVSLPESFNTTLKELIGQLQAKGELTREQADAYSKSADKSALALALPARDAQGQTVWSLMI